MIHYTLLPEPEIRTLRREYRVRVFVTLLLFVSCAIFIGSLSLLPSYFLSDDQGTKALKSAEELQKGREERGIDQVEKELSRNQVILKQLSLEKSKVVFSDLIQTVGKYRSPQILISAFELSSLQAKGTTTVTVVLQGKALTREGLIAFKKNLEQDKRFSGVELPISDLAKSKDIPFALKLSYSE